ncbi:hypothetical protein D3C72_1805690 [compost metagenome]
MSQAFHNFRYRRTDDENHDQADNQAGDQGNDQDRLQRFHTLRQTQFGADKFGHIARQETGNDTAEETGAGADGQHAAN